MTSLYRIPRRLSQSIKWRSRYAYWAELFDRLTGSDTRIHWSRVVMDRETANYMKSLFPLSRDVLEISGTQYQHAPFKSYTTLSFPDFDICKKPLACTTSYDLIIMEQVLEHVLWPLRAVTNAHAMLRPDGVLLVTTPFLVKIHDAPVDCSRWSELGLKHLLAEGGFELANITTRSWGNRACVRSNFNRWTPWHPLIHSLKNEIDFPVVVWAFAKK